METYKPSQHMYLLQGMYEAIRSTQELLCKVKALDDCPAKQELLLELQALLNGDIIKSVAIYSPTELTEMEDEEWLRKDNI